MKLFIVFLLKILLLFVLIATTFDFIYTYTFSEIINTSKFQYIKNQKGKKINYGFYGSSRVLNDINPIIIDSCLKVKSVNFGILDARPKDIMTLLKLSNYYKIKFDSVFIQTDYYYNNTQKSKFLYVDMLPYIGQNDIIKEYYSDENDFVFLYYVPFYRYCKNDAKLGLRELLASLKRNNEFEKRKGFIPLDGYGDKWQRELPNTIIKSNKYNNKTVVFLNQTKCNYMFYIAPLRNDTKNIAFVSALKNKYSKFWNFSTTIQDNRKFKNGYHLNNTGATYFSKLFANKIKEK